MYTKHQNLPQTSKHYKQSSLHSSVLVIVGVPFGVSASVASGGRQIFLIVGGLYSVTALRKLTMRVTVYTKHQLTLQKP